MRSSSAVYTRARAGFVTAAAVAAIAALAPGAQAHDNFPGSYAGECANPVPETNTPLLGRGASFQRLAQQNWGADIVDTNGTTVIDEGISGFQSVTACATDFSVAPGLHNLRYQSQGSGAGRAAFGTANGVRDRAVAYGGTDEAPTNAEITNANAGAAGSADDDALHTIPVAQSSIAVALRIPDGCQIGSGSDLTGPLRRLTREAVEGAFAGISAYDTWGDITGNRIVGSTGGLSTAVCQAKSFSRVVRLDNSGTTYQFKRYLTEVGRAGVTWATLANTAWPASGSNPLVRGAANGNGPLLDALSALSTDGGIGYSDLATARSRGFGWDGTATDRTVWAYVQRIADNAYRGPAVSNSQTGTKGSNCADVQYNDYAQQADPVANGAVLPRSTADTWISVDAVRTTEDYPICTLTYALTFEHPQSQAFVGDPSWTIAKARARKSFLNYTINGGQSVLRAADYDALPSAARTAAQTGVNNLGY